MRNAELNALEELVARFHRRKNARARLHGACFEDVYGDFNASLEFVHLRRRVLSKFLADPAAEVSVVVPVYNEEVELPATLATLALCAAEVPLGLEVVLVDNMSRDRSGKVAHAFGVRIVECRQPGLRFARATGFAAISPTSKYVWLVDADTRFLPPVPNALRRPRVANPLGISKNYLDTHQDCLAVSTGCVFEAQTMLRRLLTLARRMIKGGNSFSCWGGANQFIRVDALKAVGGIDLEVDGGEDHHRHFQLVRYGKSVGCHTRGADREHSLLAPVYTSDRRNNSIAKVWRNLRQQMRKPEYTKDEYGLPRHPKGVRYKDLASRDRGKSQI